MFTNSEEFGGAFSPQNRRETHLKAKTWLDIYQAPQAQRLELTFVDLRSEKEFEHGHVAGALNIPLLNNQERHEVGLCYKTNGKNKAIVLGMSLFKSKNQDFLKAIRDLKTSPEKPLALYCARGGMRSSLTASYLTSMGFPVILLKGGYKAYRKIVRQEIHNELPKKKFLVFHGNTGCGKSEVLRSIPWDQHGVSTLDFEDLACHSGSAFGDFNQNQKTKTQMQFENDLYAHYLKVKKASWLLVEIESSLGRVRLSSPLRRALTESPMIQLTKDFNLRVLDLSQEYTASWNTEKEDLFFKRFDLIKEKFSRDNSSKILAYARKKNFNELIEILLKEHYDPQYAKSLRKHSQNILQSFCSTHEKKELTNFIKNYVPQ